MTTLFFYLRTLPPPPPERLLAELAPLRALEPL